MSDPFERIFQPAPGIRLPGSGAAPGAASPQDRLEIRLNDAGHAQRLRIGLGEDLIHVVGRGWGVWNGVCYDFEGGEAAAQSAAVACLTALLEEEAEAAATVQIAEARIKARATAQKIDAAAAEKLIRGEIKAGRRKAIHAAGKRATVNGALELARHAFTVPLARLDADQGLFQVRNGTLDLEALAVEPPDAEDPDERVARWRSALAPPLRGHRPTRVAECAFDPAAGAPGWDRFLSLAFPNTVERLYFQRCMGMLLGGQRSEVAFILLGPGGNGKSTAIEGVKGVLGTYAQPCRIEMFIESRMSSEGPTPGEAALPGARAYMASEPDGHVTLSAGKLKGLTGGNERQANPKNRDVFSYMPVGVPVLQANKMPKSSDPSRGFWRRIFPIVFREDLSALPPEQRMDSVAVKRMLATERPGILNWLIAGWAEYRAVGLGPPAHIRELVEDLQSLSDPLGEFLRDRCQTGTGRRIGTAELHKAYKAWMEDRGERPPGIRSLNADMIAKGWAKTKVSRWYWVGLDLAPDIDTGDGGDLT